MTRELAALPSAHDALELARAAQFRHNPRVDVFDLPLWEQPKSPLPAAIVSRAQAIFVSSPEVARQIETLSDSDGESLSRAVLWAKSDIMTAASSEFAELQDAIDDYRAALLARAAQPTAEWLVELEARIAELQQLQDTMVEEEQRERYRIESTRLDARIRTMVDSVSRTDQPTAGRWSRSRVMRRVKVAQDPAEAQYMTDLENLQTRKRAILDVVTTRKRVELQLHQAWSALESRHGDVDEISGKRTRANEAFDATARAVADQGILPLYRSWLMTHVPPANEAIHEPDGSDSPSVSLLGPAVIEAMDALDQSRPQQTGTAFDVFVSHASEDKAEVARPLAEMLRGRGLRVWFDEQELTLGDSLSQKIDVGLARSRFGIVVLSPAFFAKSWPQRELDGLAARETVHGDKVILPVWHRLSLADVTSRSPTLATRLAIDTAEGLERVADAVMRALASAPPSSS